MNVAIPFVIVPPMLGFIVSTLGVLGSLALFVAASKLIEFYRGDPEGDVDRAIAHLQSQNQGRAVATLFAKQRAEEESAKQFDLGLDKNLGLLSFGLNSLTSENVGVTGGNIDGQPENGPSMPGVFDGAGDVPGFSKPLAPQINEVNRQLATPLLALIEQRTGMTREDLRRELDEERPVNNTDALVQPGLRTGFLS